MGRADSVHAVVPVTGWRMVLEKEVGFGMSGKVNQLIPLPLGEGWVRVKKLLSTLSAGSTLTRRFAPPSPNGRGGLVALFMLLFSTTALADSSALILRGVAGDEEHAQKFTKWTEETQKALVDKFGFSADRVTVLADKMTAQAEIKKAFATLKTQLKPLDTLFVFFIGHGSGEGDYKFNISGPDFTAADYNMLLTSLTVGRIVTVNGTNSSGG